MAGITTVTENEFVEALRSLVAKSQLVDLAIYYAAAPDRETRKTINEALLSGIGTAAKAGHVLSIVRLIRGLPICSDNVALYIDHALKSATRVARSKGFPPVTAALDFHQEDSYRLGEVSNGLVVDDCDRNSPLPRPVKEYEGIVIEKFLAQRADRQIDCFELALRKLKNPNPRDLERRYRRLRRRMGNAITRLRDRGVHIRILG
ncbi:hypothetical protein HY988_01060 [Candidatus Micrarchaeota archaeon]|nr:hypothetical protein [Candidatus Micrarchaeota archaeon]